MRPSLVVIGCGSFGAAVLAALERRSLGDDVLLLRAGAARATRRGTFEALGQQLAAGWPQMAAALGTPEVQVAVVAAAGDVAGGAVPALLQWLAALHFPGRRTALWVGLPSGLSGGVSPGVSGGAADASDRKGAARTYATLLELETLRQATALPRCFLRELGPDAVADAALWADALLVHMQLALGRPGEFSAFGLGVMLDPVATVADQLAPRLIAKVLAEQGHTPLAAGVAAELQQALRAPAESAPPHVLRPVWDEGQGEQWLGQTFAPYTHPALVGQVSFASLRAAAARDLKNALPVAPLHRPPGHPVRTGWVARIFQGLPLTEEAAVPWACSVTSVMPADYRGEVAARTGRAPEQAARLLLAPGAWHVAAARALPGLHLLASLPAWAAAYAAERSAAGHDLHALAEPLAGWPALLPSWELPAVELPAAAVSGAVPALDEQHALAFVRGCALGLICPGASGLLVARYLAPDREALVTRDLGPLPAAWASFAQDPALAAAVAAQADAWLAPFGAAEWAGYRRVLTWLDSQVLAVAGVDLALLRQAVARELATLPGAAPAVPTDAARVIELGQGWRYLSW